MNIHKSVLIKEAIEHLHIIKKANYIDATLGAGGHTIEILKLGGNVLGIDQDAKMLKIAQNNIAKACPPHLSEKMGSFQPILGNFRDISSLAIEANFKDVSGILYDLGVSSYHFDEFDLGFSFNKPENPLDMRLDNKLTVTSADLLNALNEKALEDLFSVVLSNNESKKLASKIIKKRKENSFKTVSDFLEIFPKKAEGSKIHPSTNAFLALRIATNQELDALRESLPKAFELLASGGYLVVLSFHSGEDRVVKNTLKSLSKSEIITKKPITPSEEELKENPRARSVKMRVIKKL